MHVFGEQQQQNIKCIVLGVACDLPAGRNFCGFLAYSATLGCTLCLKSFPGSVGCKDYSGFDRRSLKPRTNKDHRKSIEAIQKAWTKTMRNQLDGSYGCRYSVLLELDYFDPVRMLLVDQMHNLFLGAAKHTVKSVWASRAFLDVSSIWAFANHNWLFPCT